MVSIDGNANIISEEIVGNSTNRAGEQLQTVYSSFILIIFNDFSKFKL